jgi:hypothetical protein
MPLPPLVLPTNSDWQSLADFFGFVGLSDGGILPNVFPDVTTFADNAQSSPQASGGIYYDGANGSGPAFGPDWNAGLACLVPTGPPFA